MHRVFFDTNEGSHHHGYDLHLPSSIEDLQKIGDELRDGLRVAIYMPEELEMEALLSFKEESDYWIAIPVEGTIKHYY